MMKSALVKIGVPSEQAQSMRRMRRIRQILEQHDATVARLDAATNERIKAVVIADDAEDHDAPVAEAPVTAAS
jgi:hypothetical protein